MDYSHACVCIYMYLSISIFASLFGKRLQFLPYNMIVKVLVFHCTFSMDQKAVGIMLRRFLLPKTWTQKNSLEGRQLSDDAVSKNSTFMNGRYLNRLKMSTLRKQKT